MLYSFYMFYHYPSYILSHRSHSTHFSPFNACRTSFHFCTEPHLFWVFPYYKPEHAHLFRVSRTCNLAEHAHLISFTRRTSLVSSFPHYLTELAHLSSINIRFTPMLVLIFTFYCCCTSSSLQKRIYNPAYLRGWPRTEGPCKQIHLWQSEANREVYFAKLETST